jgi:hypothetical protein
MAFFLRSRLISVLTVASPQLCASPTSRTISSAPMGPLAHSACMIWLSAPEIFAEIFAVIRAMVLHL